MKTLYLEEMKRLTAVLEGKDRELEAVRMEIRKQTAALEGKDCELEVVKVEIRKLMAVLEGKDRELEAAKVEIKRLSQTLSSKDSDMEEALDRAMEAEKKCKVVQQQLQQCKNEMEDLEEKFIINRKTFVIRQKELESDIEDKERQLASATSTGERLKGKVKTLEEELEALGCSCQEKDREVGKLRREVQTVAETFMQEQKTQHLEQLNFKVKEVDKLSKQARNLL